MNKNGRTTFTDFDAFATAVREVDCTMVAQNSSFYRWTLEVANAADVEVQTGSLGSGNILEGKSWKDEFVFYLPLTSSTRYSANGATIDKNAFLVLDPNAPFSLSSDGAHDWCSVSVPKALFKDCELLSLNVLGVHDGPSQSWVTAPQPELAHKFQNLVGHVLTASSDVDNFAQSAAGRRAQTELAKVCRRIYAGNRNDNAVGNQKFERNQIIRQAKDYINTAGYADANIADMAQVIGVSERTLRNVFNDFFSTGPKKFLELSLIRAVHQQLHRTDSDEKSVTDILLDHQIFEFGRFAGRYRQIYGERPSETLRRRTSDIAG
jgi:AraC family ethanolamine operon transcriptional activator